MKPNKKITKIIIEGLMEAKVVNQVMYIDAGRIYEGMPSKIEAARLLANLSRKQFSEFFCGTDKAVLIDAISAGAKLSKADAGRVLDATIEAFHKKLKTVFGGKGQISM